MINKTETATENLLKSQLENSRQATIMYKQRLFKMANACFNELEREDLIKLMIKKKIIEKDWLQKGNKYILKQNGS